MNQEKQTLALKKQLALLIDRTHGAVETVKEVVDVELSAAQGVNEDLTAYIARVHEQVELLKVRVTALENA